MNTPITPRLLEDPLEPKSTKVMLYDLKPIRESIQEAIRSCGKHTNVVITTTTKNIDAHTLEVAVNVQHHPRGPGGGDPAHPPKKAFLWE
jgi:hypothetical protein